MSDRGFVIIGLVMYIAAFVYSLFLLKGRAYWESRGHAVLVIAGWAFQSYGLYLRGKTLGVCPISNLFETVMFITWAIVLVYLIVGFSRRLPALGEFTLPLVIAMCIFALLPTMDNPRTEMFGRNRLLSLHATLALLGYAAWALACVTGVMYLIQQRQLKSHHLRRLFLRLPAIEELDRINYRLLLVGQVLMTLGIGFGFAVGVEFLKRDLPKTAWTLTIWGIYGVLVAARMSCRLRGRKVALASIAAFTAVLTTFWGINMISTVHRF